MKPLLAVRDVAAYLRVHEMTVYRWANSGLLPIARIGGRWRIREEDLEKFVSDQSRPRKRTIR